MQVSKYSRVLVSAIIICTLFFIIIPLSTGLANSSFSFAEKVESPTGTDSSIFLPLVMKLGGQETIPINGISITITSPFMPGKLTASEPGDLNQVASAFSPNPFQELSVISIPYGPAPPVEDLPDAEPGGTDAYRNALASFRINQGGSPLPAPTASLFGQAVAGSYSIVDLITSSDTEHSTLIAEWVVEAEGSLWIIRVVRDLSDGTDPTTFLNSLQNLVIESNGVARQTKMIPSGAEVSKVDPPVQVLGALPVPSWWSGECNSSNHPNSYPLGASYDGLIACGPLGSAKSVNFGVGVTQYEWQCTELAKRYLYLKYGIPPYQANGKDVVNNMPQQYIGSLFERVPNGTPNKSPRVGDVISFGPATTFGHVAVVTSSSVDVNGNGTIGIIEQNWSTSGNRSIPVTNWRVGGSMPVSNWLRTSGSGFCDYFSNSSLNNGWAWIDPLGDSSYSLTTNPGYLRLFTPDGGHDLYPAANLNAPRLVQSISGDFVVTTKVTINPQYNYQGAGLLIWGDANNFVRLERTLVAGIDMWHNIGGVYDGLEIPFSNQTVYLRFQRSTNNITGSYSSDGLNWNVVSTVNFSSADTLQVGISLLNQWQDNPISADFDFFELNSCTAP